MLYSRWMLHGDMKNKFQDCREVVHSYISFRDFMEWDDIDNFAQVHQAGKGTCRKSSQRNNTFFLEQFVITGTRYLLSSRWHSIWLKSPPRQWSFASASKSHGQKLWLYLWLKLCIESIVSKWRNLIKSFVCTKWLHGTHHHYRFVVSVTKHLRYTL